MRTSVRLSWPAVLALVVLLSGCDMLGIESASAVAARKEAEGRAIGGACRHAGRAIEDCYAMNRKADKPAVFAGWREMNDYMRENKIDAVPPQIGPGGAAGARGGAAPRSAEPGSAPADGAARAEPR